MNWYYAEADQQRGPVTQEDFENLVRVGTVRQDTLVWREGMANWQPYREVASVPGQPATVPAAPATSDAPVAQGGIVCSQCGRPFPLDEVIRYGDSWVCAGCKPAFVQRLKEGAAPLQSTLYGGFWIRFAAKFVDGLVMRFAGAMLGLILGGLLAAASSSGRAQSAAAFLPLFYAAGIVLEVTYKTLLVGAFGATLGKMACRLRVVNPDGSEVGYAKALGRALAEYVSIITIFIGYIIAGFDEEKRTLHDRLCGTRVVRKPS